MRPHDVACVLALLQRFYGSSWPALPWRGAELWCEDLGAYPYDVASQAVRQWYRTHHADEPPTLAQVVATIKTCQGQQQRQAVV